MNKTLLFGLFFILLVAGGYFLFLPEEEKNQGEQKEPDPIPNITVSSPVEGEEIGLPLIIKGEARVFEGTVNIRLREKSGDVLVEGFTTAKAEDVGQFGPFKKELSYPIPKELEGALEVFQISAKDGSEIDKVVIPVLFKDVEFLMVKVFFQNENDYLQFFDCDKVHSVERRIAKTEAIARAAINELLMGPTVTEMKQGFVTNINTNVQIQSLNIENNTAYIDFDDRLDYEVGGSCRVIAIQSQITETLTQFSTVNNVVISINENTENVLQP
ncbi:Gmad2 immunoglobulin-like domain-containing protein [Patescibacteria group bacterium]